MLTDDLLFSSRFLVVAGIRNHCLFTIQIMFQESVGDESWQAAVFMFEVYGIPVSPHRFVTCCSVAFTKYENTQLYSLFDSPNHCGESEVTGSGRQNFIIFPKCCF